MKKRKSEDPVVAGTLHSTEKTDKQLVLFNYITYFGKIAKEFSLTKVAVKIPRPDGLGMFLSEVEAENAQRISEGKTKLNDEELQALENNTRYDILKAKELGNGQSILNHLMGEAFTGDKYRKIIDEAKEEALALAFQSMNSEKQKEPKTDVSLR